MTIKYLDVPNLLPTLASKSGLSEEMAILKAASYPGYNGKVPKVN